MAVPMPHKSGKVCLYEGAEQGQQTTHEMMRQAHAKREILVRWLTVSC